MSAILFILYLLILSLWTGGIALFSFIVTPAIFRSFGRDTAGQIVGALFPGYFSYTCILSIVACVLFFVVVPIGSFSARLCMVLLPVAVLVNVFIVFKLHPEMSRLKLQITSFEHEPPDSIARRRFKKLHALSALLNLLLLFLGLVLLIASLFIQTALT